MTGFVRRLRRARERPEGGYVAILTAVLLTVLMGFVAFTVDVGRWYVVGQELQRTADAAALAGVTSLPNDPAAAFATARQFAAANGSGGGTGTTVATAVGKAPTQLQTTVTTTVDNIFGPLLGVPQTTISRTAVADYAAPVPMGSPCNKFGNDPDPGTATASSACAGITGAFWADVNSPTADKQYGDAVQAKVCASKTGMDGCAGSTNTDYDPNGYFYTVHVAKPGSVAIQLFDPVWVKVGDTCKDDVFSGADKASNPFVSNPSTRYASGTSGEYCTGDKLFGGSTLMQTQFTVRAPSDTPWDPLSFAPIGGCQRTYGGYQGQLVNVLDQGKSTYDPAIARYFRTWTTLCTVTATQPGDYLIQVKSNGLGADSAKATNRFSIRATSSAGNDAVSVSGRQQMAIYSNKPSNVTQFYLARVPSSAAGQVLNVRLYDVGDSTQTGKIKFLAPPDSGVTFTGCVGNSPGPGAMPDCSFSVPTDTYDGKWVTVSVPIPTGYKCADDDASSCWVRLAYDYGSGSAPTDTTTWRASLAGDPVRLVQ